MSDAQLLSLGREFEMVADQIDREVCGKSCLVMDAFKLLMERFDRVWNEIISTQAGSVDGLRVKARAVCWAQMGDLDCVQGDKGDKPDRMALSIVRDLVRPYDADLERPGAIAKLIAENEAGAS